MSDIRKAVQDINARMSAGLGCCTRMEMPLGMVRKMAGVDEGFLRLSENLSDNAVVVWELDKPLTILVDDENRVLGFR